MGKRRERSGAGGDWLRGLAASRGEAEVGEPRGGLGACPQDPADEHPRRFLPFTREGKTPRPALQSARSPYVLQATRFSCPWFGVQAPRPQLVLPSLAHPEHTAHERGVGPLRREGSAWRRETWFGLVKTYAGPTALSLFLCGPLFESRSPGVLSRVPTCPGFRGGRHLGGCAGAGVNRKEFWAGGAARCPGNGSRPAVRLGLHLNLWEKEYGIGTRISARPVVMLRGQ